jgi:hypothetical protein
MKLYVPPVQNQQQPSAPRVGKARTGCLQKFRTAFMLSDVFWFKLIW